MSKFLVGIAILVSLAACDTPTSKDKVIDIHQQGYFNPGLCVDKSSWLITVQRPDGTKGDKCVSPDLGRKQKIGSLFVTS